VDALHAALAGVGQRVVEVHVERLGGLLVVLFGVVHDAGWTERHEAIL
jgi:hypothetical protein